MDCYAVHLLDIPAGSITPGRISIEHVGKKKVIVFQRENKCDDSGPDGEGESDGFVVTDDRGLIVFGCVDGVKHSEDRNIVLESEGKEIKVVFDEDTDAENFVWTWNAIDGDDSMVISAYRSTLTLFSTVTNTLGSYCSELLNPFQLAGKCTCSRDSCLTTELWSSYFDENGVVENEKGLRELIFRRSFSDELRPDGWKFLLGIYSYDTPLEDRVKAKSKQAKKYFEMKDQYLFECEGGDTYLKDQMLMIKKDVRRTDRDQPFYTDDTNIDVLKDILLTYVAEIGKDLGFVQGMPDLLSPLLYVLNDEAEAFWAFVKLMTRMKMNFKLNQSETKRQLKSLEHLLQCLDEELHAYLHSRSSDIFYLCFRWIVVSFRREFSFNDILPLWDVLFTELPTSNFHLFICVAMILKARNDIMKEQNGFEDILLCFNRLSMKMKVPEVLCDAEALFLQLNNSVNVPSEVCKLLGKSPDKNEFYLQSALQKSFNLFL